VNRKQRRAAHRRQCSAKQIRALERRVEQTGLPGVIRGLTDACVDCDAGGSLILLPGNRVVGQVYHSDSCPALAGVVEWRPVPDRDP
jgi:hypothetical protein